LGDWQWIENLLPTHTADFGPDLEFLGPGCSVLGGSDVIAAETKEVVDLIVGREEPLRLAGRFELLHLPLSSARRLVRVFRSVVQPLVLGRRLLGSRARAMAPPLARPWRESAWESARKLARTAGKFCAPADGFALDAGFSFVCRRLALA
jgi:hypothetical protein